jgi:hypothetical protein
MRLSSMTTAAVLLFASSSAHAYTSWIQRHAVCHKGFQENLPKPSPQMHNPVVSRYSSKEDSQFVKAWGHIMAFPGTNGNKAGLWILAKGNSYFVELPKPEVKDSVPQVLAPQNEWLFTANFADKSYPMDFVVHREASNSGITSIDVSPARRLTFEHPSVQLMAVQESPEELQSQSTQILKLVLENNIRLGGVFRDGRKYLAECSKVLDPNNKDESEVARLIAQLDKMPDRYDGERQYGSDYLFETPRGSWLHDNLPLFSPNAPNAGR